MQHQPAALDRQFQASTYSAGVARFRNRKGALIFSMWMRPSCTASTLLAIPRIASNLPAELTEQSPRLIDDCAQELILREHERDQLGRVVDYDIWAKARHLQGLH